MIHVVYYVCMSIALISVVIAAIVMMRYTLHQLRLCKDVQGKLVATFEQMLEAHEITLEALQATEDYLKYIAERYTDQDEVQNRLCAKIHHLEEETEDVQRIVLDMYKESLQSGDDAK